MQKNIILIIGILLLVATCVAVVSLNVQDEPPTSQPANNTSDESPTAELALEKQKQIWDNEHVTFELEKRFGKSFLQSLLDKDATAIAAFFREGFVAEKSGDDDQKQRVKDFLSEAREEKQADSTTLNTESFSNHLLNVVTRFQRVERKRFKVLRIEELNQEQKQWKAQLLIELVGRGTSQSNTDTTKSSSSIADLLMYSSTHWIETTIEDEKKLGDTASIDRWSVEKEIWRQSSQPLFHEATTEVGLSKVPMPDRWKSSGPVEGSGNFQVAVADYNNDGWLDIAVALINGPPLLLESREGKEFKDVTTIRGISRATVGTQLDRYLACWIDYDNDGWQDLLIGDRLLHNSQGKQFEDVTARSRLRVLRECMGAITADYDADGLLDLYLMYQRDFERPEPEKLKWVGDEESGRNNQLWHNEGNGEFRDVTEESNAGGGTSHTFAGSWFFLNEDHYPDLYLANDFGKNVILQNRADGTFEDVSSNFRAEDFATSMGVATGDINNDGRSDIYVANMYSKMGRRIICQVCDEDYPQGIFEQIKGSCEGNRLYVANTDGDHDEVSEEWDVNAVGWAFAPALFDLDSDGFLDIYATAGYMSFARDKPDG